MNNNKGIWFGIAAYGMWGLLPLFWKLLKSVPATQIVANRLIWSLAFVLAVLAIRHDWAWWKSAFNRRTLLIYLCAAVLLTLNWLLYIYAVNAGLVVEASLGYFINPLINVLLGVIFLGERLPLAKWVSIGLAAAGVTYLTVRYGAFPWLAIGMALTFGFYGLVKKLSPFDALRGLSMETLMAFLPCLTYLLVLEFQGQGAFLHSGPQISLLLMLSGVITSVPLLLFASAARSIPLSTMGVLQYLSPTLQFLLAVFLYGEPFNRDQLVGFSIIWVALIIFTFSGMIQSARKSRGAALPVCDEKEAPLAGRGD